MSCIKLNYFGFCWNQDHPDWLSLVAKLCKNKFAFLNFPLFQPSFFVILFHIYSPFSCLAPLLQSPKHKLYIV